MWDHEEHLSEQLLTIVAATAAAAEATPDVTPETVAAAIDALEEAGCDHPTYYLEEPGRYKPRWPGGWCQTCEEWRSRLLGVVSGDPDGRS